MYAAQQVTTRDMCAKQEIAQVEDSATASRLCTTETAVPPLSLAVGGQDTDLRPLVFDLTCADTIVRCQEA